MSAVLKTTTKLAGIQVKEKPKEILSGLYRRTLSLLQSMPKEYGYRVHSEKLILDRLTTIEENDSIGIAERKYGFQAEELILHAEGELRCARTLTEYKAWEPLINIPPETQWKWPVEN